MIQGITDIHTGLLFITACAIPAMVTLVNIRILIWAKKKISSPHRPKMMNR